MGQLLNFLEWIGRFFLLSPDDRLDILLFFDPDMVDYPPRAPLLSRPARMALICAAISLPPSLTLSLYLLQWTQHHPMFFPMVIGITAIMSLMFQLVGKLVRVNI